MPNGSSVHNGFSQKTGIKRLQKKLMNRTMILSKEPQRNKTFTLRNFSTLSRFGHFLVIF